MKVCVQHSWPDAPFRAPEKLNTVWSVCVEVLLCLESGSGDERNTTVSHHEVFQHLSMSLPFSEFTIIHYSLTVICVSHSAWVKLKITSASLVFSIWNERCGHFQFYSSALKWIKCCLWFTDARMKSLLSCQTMTKLAWKNSAIRFSPNQSKEKVKIAF